MPKEVELRGNFCQFSKVASYKLISCQLAHMNTGCNF